jgi:hypothetical protein
LKLRAYYVLVALVLAALGLVMAPGAARAQTASWVFWSGGHGELSGTTLFGWAPDSLPIAECAVAQATLIDGREIPLPTYASDGRAATASECFWTVAPAAWFWNGMLWVIRTDVTFDPGPVPVMRAQNTFIFGTAEALAPPSFLVTVVAMRRGARSEVGGAPHPVPSTWGRAKREAAR